MSWSTIGECREFLKGATAYPQFGLIKCGVDLPGQARSWNQRQDMRTLADYRTGSVANSFYDFTHFISGWDVGDFLNHNYTDQQGRWRRIRQLGGHKSGLWGDKGLHLTQRSDTLGDGKPNQYHHFVMEHEYGTGLGENAAMFVARNLAFTAMASSRTDGVPFVSTAATGFATTQDDLIQGLNAVLFAKGWGQPLTRGSSLLEISAALYLANYGSHPSDTNWQGSRAVASGREGSAEVSDLNIPRSKFLAAVLNNVSGKGNSLWERSFYRAGIVPMDQQLADHFVAQQGWNRGPGVLDRMAGNGLNIHQRVYGAITRAVSEGTGIGQ